MTPEPTETSTPEPTETATPEPTDTATATPAPAEPPGVKAFIDGFEVTYIGALVMESGSTVQLTFCVVDSEGQPASGEFFATLGDPPGDPHASHGSGIIGPDGKVTITMEVTWPAGGETQLWFFYPDAVHPIAKILITQ